MRTADGRLIADYVIERNGRRGIVIPRAWGAPEATLRRAVLLRDAFDAAEAVVVVPDESESAEIGMAYDSVWRVHLIDLFRMVRDGWPSSGTKRPVDS